MNETLMYFLKVNIAIALFYLFYRLFFVGDTLWKTRRFYLLFTLLIAFTYPFMSIQNWLENQEPMQTFVANYNMMQEFTITPIEESKTFSMETLLLAFYLTVSSALLIRMIIQLFSILSIRLKGEKIHYQGLNIISLESKVTPFSFFGNIYLNPSLHTEYELKQIIAHELTHVKQLHSFDVIIAELVKTMFWINPATWLLNREIRQNLEYLADNKVIESGFDSKNYQYHLLQLSYQTPDLNLTNKFNISPLKKRITMMNQQKTSKAGLFKYLLIIPLVLALVVSSNAETIIQSAKEKLMNENQTQPEKKKIAIDELTVVGYGNTETTPASEKSVKVAVSNIKETKKSEDVIFQVVEVMPEYPGGQSEMFEFLSQNIKYPVDAQKIGQQAKIFVQFIVSATGKIKNANVISTEVKDVKIAENQKEAAEMALASLKKEALRVVNAMPDWTPGQQRGKKVNVQYTLPINFVLQGKTDAKKFFGSPDEPFMVVEEMPKFPGGDQAMFKFLGENVKYPVEAQEKGIQGRVICSFIVNKDGSIDEITVVRSVDKNLDNEAVRVIKSMPNWTPGKQRGEVVRVKYTLPVNFKLNGGPTTNPWGDKPIVILDGQRMPPKFDYNIIKPEMIAKVEVIKPETDEMKSELTSKYGKWSDNGVIIITTKK